MANANLTMGVTGIDKTGAAFNSIKMRAKATGASIRASRNTPKPPTSTMVASTTCESAFLS